MPNLFKIDYEAVVKELAIWHATHRAMKPFIIMSEATLRHIEADNREFTYLALKRDDYVCQMMGTDVAVCNSLGLGEFKVR